MTYQDDEDWLRSALAAAPPPGPGPERVARWKAALAAEPAPAPVAAIPADQPRPGSQPDPVHRPQLADQPQPDHPTAAASRIAGPPGTGRPHRTRPGRRTRPSHRSRTSWAPRPAGLAAAAAAIAAIAVAGLPADSAHPADPIRPTEPGPLVLTRAELPTAALGGYDLGPLADPASRHGCLARLGVTEQPLGGRRVVLDGRPGVLLALPTGQLGRLRLLVVDPSCGPGGAEVLADQVTGG